MDNDAGFDPGNVIKDMAHKNTAVSRLVNTLTGLCAALCLALTAAAQIPADMVHVDVPVQSLSSALTQFGRDTGTEIEFAPEDVRGKTSVALRGDYDRVTAIKLLLAGAGLSYRMLPQGAIVVEPSLPRSARTGAQPQTRSAAGNPVRIDTLTVEGRRQRPSASILPVG